MLKKSNYIFVERGKETVRIINYFSLTVFEVPYQLWNRIDDWVKYDLELVEKLVANGILVQKKYKEKNYLEYIYNSRFFENNYFIKIENINDLKELNKICKTYNLYKNICIEMTFETDGYHFENFNLFIRNSSTLKLKNNKNFFVKKYNDCKQIHDYPEELLFLFGMFPSLQVTFGFFKTMLSNKDICQEFNESKISIYNNIRDEYKAVLERDE